MHDQPADAMPADDSIVEVLRRFRELGFSHHHRVRSGMTIECGSCGGRFEAGEMRIAAQHRVEGTSDPADMQHVLGIRCPDCGERGAMVLAYGPTASIDEIAVYEAIELREVPDPLGRTGG